MVLALEMHVFQQVIAARYHLLTEFFVPVTAFGSLTFAIILITGLYLVRERRTAFLVGTGVIVAGGIEKALNLVVQRPRPDTAHRLIAGTASGYGFPSGHTTLAFVLATLLASQYPRLRWLLYTLAVLVGVSRVYLGMHYPADVLAGAALGAATGWLIRRRARTLVRIAPFNLRN